MESIADGGIEVKNDVAEVEGDLERRCSSKKTTQQRNGVGRRPDEMERSLLVSMAWLKKARVVIEEIRPDRCCWWRGLSPGSGGSGSGGHGHCSFFSSESGSRYEIGSISTVVAQGAAKWRSTAELRKRSTAEVLALIPL